MRMFHLKRGLIHLFWIISIVLVFLVFTAAGDDYCKAEGGPKLAIVSVDSKMKVGCVGSVLIELENLGDVVMKPKRSPQSEVENMLAALEGEMELEASKAAGIEARLASKDDNVEVLSGPQLAGSLQSGDVSKRPLEFQVRVDGDANAGIYPMVLELSYQVQNNVLVGGNPLYPEIQFQRDSAQEIISLEVTVIAGPRIVVKEIRGNLSPGHSSRIEVTLENRGDEPAVSLRAKLEPQPWFKLSDDALEASVIGEIAPGKSKKTEFSVEVEDDIEPGDVGLICQIWYTSGEEWQEYIGVDAVETTEELALLTKVENHSIFRTFITISILAMLIIALYLGGASKHFPKIKRRKKW